jgi:hypothetical protein
VFTAREFEHGALRERGEVKYGEYGEYGACRGAG